MIIDLRKHEDEDPRFPLREDLRFLKPTTQNQLVIYCQKKGIDKHKVEEIYIGDGGMKLREAVNCASNIASHFNALVHFECRGSPGTVFPTTRGAAIDNYKRRRRAGETTEDDRD